MLTSHPDDPACRFYEDSRADYQRAQDIEAYAEELMSDCRVLVNAQSINEDNDLYDGDLLPRLMVEICQWNGSSLNAAERMKALFNIMADEFQRIAEKEIA